MRIVYTVEIRDYEPYREPVGTKDIEQAVFDLLDQRSDDGIVIVNKTGEQPT